ncbi:uncharacterized protein LOC119907128 [Micropterus salmoides]|uniref:uncharacterized protein LOC119907128 n=1 Tax=Micropterus salmoides TaxID=27706 RepID=UPI0018EC8AD1|nr:uncharacterized protein LOC119907128 [Micropterus salmoides]
MKPYGLCVIIVQLSLAAGMDADWTGQRHPSGSNLGNRAYPQMTPPRFDSLHMAPGDAGKWPTDRFRDTGDSKQMSVINTSVGLWFTGPQILSMLKTKCRGITDSRSPAFHALCSINQTVPACGTCLTKEAFPVYLTHSDTEDTFETEIVSNQQLTTFKKGDTKYSHQTIVIMEEDPAVIESATYLFERHPTVSTLLQYQKGALHVLRGSHFSSTRNHVILVGHGSNGTNGPVQLGGYGPEELARVVSTLKSQSIFSHLGTISIVSCNLGNDRHFMLQLLQVLRSFSVETKLHLHNSLLSVSSDGAIMTWTDGVWRAHDHSRRVIAELDQRGDLLTKVELGCAGPVFPDYKGNVLYIQTLEWPSHPQMFVPVELRKKYPSIICLEGLTWSLFFEENERRRASDYVPSQKHLKAIWLTEPGPDEDNIVFKHISNIQDLLVEIRYNAREEVASDLYYVLNECIYKVHGKNLSVSLVGKFMSTDNQAEIDLFRQNFNVQQGEPSLQELRQGLKASKFNDFCRQTFQFQQCNFNCERWGQYFMAAVFSASVRNFRTFSLFLMSVIGCEVGRSRGMDSPLCTAFVGAEHPMVTDDPWPEPLQRGFYGCSVDNYEQAPPNRQIWLDQVVAKENALYVASKQIMNAAVRDEQTELDIFGKVKVMNKYVFSSYLEFFRGTPEGKKLKRGCTPSFQENLNP